jgi:hypothetical protein
VLKLVGLGMSNAEIAAALYIRLMARPAGPKMPVTRHASDERTTIDSTMTHRRRDA